MPVTGPAASQPDDKLVARVRAGDERAFDELGGRHLADARRAARICADDHDEAEDLVAEAFERLYSRLRDGHGLGGALPPYLRTTIRRLAAEWHRDDSQADHAMLAVLPTADQEIVTAADRQLVREAFETLPERWQRALWFLEIEGRPPHALVPSLGSTPNAAAALAHRAREGLRQAYLAVALSAAVPTACGPYVPRLAPHVHGTLSDTDAAAVAAHLGQCPRCRRRRDELLMLFSNVRATLAPALVGPLLAVDGAAYVERGGAVPSAGRAEAPGAHRRRRRVVRVAATTLVSAAAAAAVAFAAVSAMSPRPATSTLESGAAPTVSADRATPTGAHSPPVGTSDASPGDHATPAIDATADGPEQTPSAVPPSPAGGEPEAVAEPRPAAEQRGEATTADPESAGTAPATRAGTSTSGSQAEPGAKRQSQPGRPDERSAEGVCQLLERVEMRLPPFCS